MASEKTQWLSIGSVARPFGIQGGFKIHLPNPKSTTLREGLRIRLEAQNQRQLELTLKKVRPGGRVDVQEFSSPDDVQPWIRAQVLVQREELPELSEEEFYLVDCLNAEVQSIEGEVLGVIVGFSDNGAQPLAEIKTASQETFAVPFVWPLVQSIDRDAGVVVMDLPEGLRDQ